MKVYIANFGQENFLWPECLRRNTIATLNTVDVQKMWEVGDREAYISHAMKGKTAAGIPPTRPVASRWFNLMTIITESSRDVWIHREKDQLWWTLSRNDPPSFEAIKEPVGAKRDAVVCHKPCDQWSNNNRSGNRLMWNGLHAKARDFLFTEGTLQRLNEENAKYALALLNGEDLSSWHSQRQWRAKEESTRSRRAVGTVFNSRQKAVARMAMTAMGTANFANGQQVLRTLKNKECRFASQQDFERYIAALIDIQERLCALTGLPLQFDGDHEDIEMLASLDRIDSDGHYELDNLQVVCRFANRWKSNGKDEEFKRLIEVVRSCSEL